MARCWLRFAGHGVTGPHISQSHNLTISQSHNLTIPQYPASFLKASEKSKRLSDFVRAVVYSRDERNDRVDRRPRKEDFARRESRSDDDRKGG